MELWEQLVQLEQAGFVERSAMSYERTVQTARTQWYDGGFVTFGVTQHVFLYDGEGGNWKATQLDYVSPGVPGPLAALACAELANWGQP